MSPDPAYVYRARAIRTIDGDTFVADVDLGFRTHAHIKVRIRGLDTPERGKDGWAEARDRLDARLFIGHGWPEDLVLTSFKDRQSFERWVCDVWVEGDDRTLAERLAEGVA